MIKVALIGVGRWGKNIRRTLGEVDGVETVAFNRNAPLPRMVKKRGIEAVIVATPASTHAQVALPYLKADLPVFIEKPLAASLKDAREIARAGQNTVMVGHIHLYNPAFVKAKETAEKIGPVRYIRFEGMNNGPVREDVPAWWDWGPHGVSLITDVLGENPSHVQAWSFLKPASGRKLEGAAEVRLLFPGGAEGQLSVNWHWPEKRVRLTVTGAEGTVVWDDTADRKVTWHHHGRARHPRYSRQPPLKLELLDFIRMAKGKVRPRAGLEEGLQTVKILDAAERSIALGGRAVPVPNS